MAAEGASSRARLWPVRHWTAQRWRALLTVPNRTPLRTKLLAALLALVIIALAAISVSSFWLLRSYMTSQDDPQLQTIYSSIVNSNQPLSFVPGQLSQVHGLNIRVGVQQSGTPLSSVGGQSGVYGYGGSSAMQSLPSVPTSAAWADLNRG